MIVSWQRKILGRRTSGLLCAGYDLMPTFAELAGVTAPQQTTGISFLPELLGREQTPHDYLYFELYEQGAKLAVRQGKWKAVRHHGTGRTELYDLSKDRNELVDIAHRHPDTVKRMNRILKRENTPSSHYPLAGTFFD